jgi:hypothetical protein
MWKLEINGNLFVYIWDWWSQDPLKINLVFDREVRINWIIMVSHLRNF